MKLRFGTFEIDTDTFVFRVDGAASRIEPQTFDLLVYLASNPDRIISRDELIEHVWGGRIVSESSIDSRIAAARRAVGDDGKQQAVIETVPRRGIRLLAEVTREDESAAEASYSRPHLHSRPTIAVLPFDETDASGSAGGLAFGFCDDIISALSRFRAFHVTARTSSFLYRTGTADVRTVARELGADYILEGSVRASGDRLRVTAQLIDAENGMHVWSDRYDRTMGDIFDIQDDIAQRVCTALDGALTLEGLRRARLAQPDNLDAWLAYHRGLDLYIQSDAVVDPSEYAVLFERGLSNLEKAHALDPDFARPLSLMARMIRTNVVQYRSPHEQTPVLLDRALNLSRRAIELDPQDGTHHFAYGAVLSAFGHWDEALKEIETGLQLSPGAFIGYYDRAFVRALGGGSAEGAMEDIGTFVRLSPMDPFYLKFRFTIGAYALLRMKRWKKAAEWAEEGMKATPTLPWPACSATAAYNMLGELERAEECVAEAIRRRPRLTLSRLRRNIAYLADEEFKDWYLEQLVEAGFPDE